MFYVTYAQMVLIVSAIWIIIRSICAIRYKKLSLKIVSNKSIKMVMYGYKLLDSKKHTK